MWFNCWWGAVRTALARAVFTTLGTLPAHSGARGSLDPSLRRPSPSMPAGSRPRPAGSGQTPVAIAWMCSRARAGGKPARQAPGDLCGLPDSPHCSTGCRDPGWHPQRQPVQGSKMPLGMWIQDAAGAECCPLGNANVQELLPRPVGDDGESLVTLNPEPRLEALPGSS